MSIYLVRLFVLVLVLTALGIGAASAQPLWNGILDPTRAIDWQTYTGIPGGIPSGSWTQCGSTVPAGSSAATIQAAINACGTNQYVLLAAGSYSLTSSLSIKSNMALRGAGANQTILSFSGATTFINMGTGSIYGTAGTAITGGATAGSMSITVSSASGMAVGGYLMISELNASYVTNTGTSTPCTWCDSGYSGTRLRGQIVEITGISGTTIGISPPLHTAYTLTPTAVYFAASAKYAGVENLQLYDNNSSSSPGSNIHMSECAYCWVRGVESNYAGNAASADHMDVDFCFRGEISNSYFSNSYIHSQGSADSEVGLRNKTSGFRVINNIFERLHISVLVEWGAAGNVIAYNFSHGNFDVGSGSPNVVMGDILANHGAHPQFNLYEGNVSASIYSDIWWGSASHSTLFRNWEWGTTKICSPESEGRQTVSCGTIITAYQAALPVNISWGNNYSNIVGNVAGSSLQQSIGASHVAYCVAGSCTRDYGSQSTGTNYNHSFGFGNPSDTGGQTGDSTLPYTSALIHGEYSVADGSVVWGQGVTDAGSQTAISGHVLPNSFFLSSKPSWWRSGVPWPPIGPDVTGGTGGGGITASTVANRNSALDAYLTMGGTVGAANTPLATFNAETLYGSGTPTCAITPTAIGPYTAGQTVSQQFTASNCGSSSWGLSGNGGTGLTINSGTGLLSGTAATPGTYPNFTVSYGAESKTMTLIINSAGGTNPSLAVSGSVSFSGGTRP